MKRTANLELPFDSIDFLDFQMLLLDHLRTGSDRSDPARTSFGLPVRGGLGRHSPARPATRLDEGRDANDGVRLEIGVVPGALASARAPPAAERSTRCARSRLSSRRDDA